MEAQCSWRIAYYKVHHPQEFDKNFFDMYADDNNMRYIIGGYEEVIKAIWKLEQSSRNGNDYDIRKCRHYEIALEMFARGIEYPKNTYHPKGMVMRNIDIKAE